MKMEKGGLLAGEVDPEDANACADMCRSFDRIMIYVSPFEIMNAILELKEEKGLRITRQTITDKLRGAAYRGLDSSYGGA